MRILYFYLALLSLLYPLSGKAKGIDADLKINADPPSLDKDDHLVQDIFYTSDSNFKGFLQIACYKYSNNGDSFLIYSKKNIKASFRKGLNSQRVNFSQSDTNTFCHTKYQDIIKKTKQIPAGEYRIFVCISSPTDTLHFDFVHEMDSTLSPHSDLYKEINSTMVPKPKKFLGIDLSKKINNGASAAALNAFNKVNKRTDRLMKAKGLTPVSYKRDGKQYTDIFYDDWFVGRYAVKKDDFGSKEFNKGKGALKIKPPTSQEGDDLDENQSAFSQMQKQKKNDKEKKEMNGEISLSTNLGSAQEPNSAVDNNYYELAARFEVPVLGMPVDFEGLYTSQDADRLVKASYFRMHYDVDKAKSALTESINKYKNKVQEEKSKGTGTEQIYQSYINNLEKQKSNLLKEAEKEKNVGSISAKDINTSEAKQEASNKAKAGADSTGGGTKDVSTKTSEAKNEESKIKASAANKKRQAEERYKKIQALEKKIDKYKKLLAQQKNNRYFDSTLANTKLKNLEHADDKTYKQLSKGATNLLPDGQARSFLSGITHLDAGMFPKYESKYTMSGQMMKGADVGYDFGICRAGVTVGQTQYIGRDGNMDKYTCYSGSVTFNPLPKEKIGLVYYGYTPSRKMFTDDNFFKNIDIAAPSFKQPVNIISLNYAGNISKNVSMSAEAATSLRNGDSAIIKNGINSPDDNMAYSLDITGAIPQTSINIEGKYDKTGTNFENNTIPVSLAGTEQYQLASKGDFFRSFLSLGIEYDYLIQNNFAGKGSSTKWGFTMATHSKQYPSVSLSYKPFTTFRSVSDTFNIPQRPMLGSVLTSKISYQLKDKGKSWRFMLLYNKSTSTMDTISYGSTLLQISCTYTYDKIMLTAIAGNTQMSSSVAPVITPGSVPALPGNTRFIGLNGSYMLSKQVNLSGGQDLGFTNFGLCRFAPNVGGMYQFSRIPLTLRLNLRYSSYELQEGQGWQKIYSGFIDMVWSFKSKLSKHSKD